MSDLTKAIAIALRAHQGQKDQGGEPHILHCIRVMNKMAADENRVVAIMHDVMEDSTISQQDLTEMGFNEITVRAIEALTRRLGESYFDYIRRIKVSDLAVVREIKIADLEDNFRRHDCLMSLARRHQRALDILGD